ncbi:MAG: epoxyqueuosine reductase QueH [Candidatus Omnitrophota bacterium]|nr:epoxyqueuosine reductase QueH [Candidatus Omnitrophota bacterium]
MKLLLHTCCAPCLIYPVEQLKKKHFKVTGLFYNPNISPLAEYDTRLNTLKDYSRDIKFDLIVGKNDCNNYLNLVAADAEKPQRCNICWQMRLKEAAQFAKDNNFDSFSTTLLVSPYQDQDLLKITGEKVAEDTDIEFYFEDFRPGFREAQERAKRANLYRQKYCGCAYSELERCKKSVKP